jgi:hypothetical protein
VILYVWDANRSYGVSGSLTMAQLRARDVLIGGKTDLAVVQAARLTLDTDLEHSYERLGSAWQAHRTASGGIRWSLSHLAT